MSHRLQALIPGALTVAVVLLVVACFGGSGKRAPEIETGGSPAHTDTPATATTPTPISSPTRAIATPAGPIAIEKLPAPKGVSLVAPKTQPFRYDASAGGVPVVFTVPPGWRLFYAPRLVGAGPPDATDRGMAIAVRPRGNIASAAEAFDTVLAEADGALESLDAVDLELPEGFEAGGATRVARNFEIGARPNRLLSNWLGVEGVRTYWAVALLYDTVVLAAVESIDEGELAGLEEIFRGFRLAGPSNGCTLVIGYSQTNQWYRANDAFESIVENAGWQLLAVGGAGVDRWRDPEFSGWDAELHSACIAGWNEPVRVVVSISGPYGDDEEEWTDAIRETVERVRERYPSADQVVLQPIVGGPTEACPAEGAPRGQVRASWQYAHIRSAIANVVGGDVVEGLPLEVRSCEDYSDRLGHLTAAGAEAAGQALGQYYRSE